MLQFMWDILMTYLKYNEGYFNYNGHIISKPFILWAPTHQRKAEAFDYVQCVTFSMEAGMFLLLQSFWNYLSNTVAKKTFMSSFEFRIYILGALASIALFPILQWVFRNDPTKREAIPQLVFSIEVFIVACLGIRTHFRFKRLISLTQRANTNNQKGIIVKLSYFKDMNKLTIIILYCYSIGFIILCVDGLTTNQFINQNKFAIDVLIANTNVCTVYLLILLISIFHPRPQYSKPAEISSHDNTSQKQPQSKKTTEFSEDNLYGRPTPVNYHQTFSSETLNSPGVFAHNMSIEDPYSSQPVMFSMIDLPSKPSQIPLNSSSGYSFGDNMRMSTGSPTAQVTGNYMEKKIWEEGDVYSQPITNSSQTPLNKDDISRDWLWQSPDRRNM
ncbi:hypothetical protein G6F62_006192 [Rhizopus arrhizus]|nr:hypothetical protein G6F62_006192 [Rhizopus arrhizus]